MFFRGVVVLACLSGLALLTFGGMAFILVFKGNDYLGVRAKAEDEEGTDRDDSFDRKDTGTN